MSISFNHKSNLGLVGSGSYRFRHYGASTPATYGGLCFTANTAGSTVTMSVNGTPTLGQNFSYSTDGSTWSTFTPGTTTITLTNVGDKVYFKGNNPNGLNEYYTSEISEDRIFYQFVITGSIAASGNIMSLIDNGACNTLVIPNDYCFGGLFLRCTNLTSPPELPATTLTKYCYADMFLYCTLFQTIPTLPATTLAEGCYQSMFANCLTNLTSIPALFTADTVMAPYCCYRMFFGCRHLTTASTLYPTTLANNCYEGMFEYCQALTTPPVLPATTLASECYKNMFNDCTSLTTAPSLPATTMVFACYNSMFNDCTSLTTPPALPATTLAAGCYSNMFDGCSSLTTAPALPATTLAFACYQYMFGGCHALTTAPALPADTLVAGCYSAMFNGCWGLVTPPALRATTLAEYCYDEMFYNCTSLQVNDSPVSGTAEQAWRVPTSGTISGSDYYIYYNTFGSCLGTRSSDELYISGGQSYTYYTQNTPI